MRITNVKIITMDGMRPALAVQNITFLHNTGTLLNLPTLATLSTELLHCIGPH